jgi:hypothetical protein
MSISEDINIDSPSLFGETIFAVSQKECAWRSEQERSHAEPETEAETISTDKNNARNELPKRDIQRFYSILEYFKNKS